MAKKKGILAKLLEALFKPKKRRIPKGRKY
jgi:hypothetical protein